MSNSLIAGKKKILITCPKGIAPVLQKELELLDFRVFSAMEAGVATEGTIADAIFLNLHIRTGHRVLFPVLEFMARDVEDLYRELSGVAWEEWVDERGYICMTSNVDNPSVKDARYVNVRCKDAVVDRMRLKTGIRPDSGPDRGGLVFFIHWKTEKAAVYLDTSGIPLCRRGYRKIPLDAPMQETLAAAIVMSSGWGGEGNFINPMCGSGTLAIEAALIGLKRAPGLLRSNYSFMHMRGFDEALWEGLRREARKAGAKGLTGRIIATDIRQEAVEAARRNAATAGVEHLIEFSVSDYAGTEVPEGGGTVIVNPEYGARMGKVRELEAVYKGIGDFFKQKCRGYRGHIFTGNLELAKKVGLRSSKRTIFYNGEIECRLLEYELYGGSRKHAGENAGSQ
jgi:23S rRNA (guanine2445-N2)-methyltransferase